jgi:hypothetical protein
MAEERERCPAPASSPDIEEMIFSQEPPRARDRRQQERGGGDWASLRTLQINTKYDEVDSLRPGIIRKHV